MPPWAPHRRQGLLKGTERSKGRSRLADAPLRGPPARLPPRPALAPPASPHSCYMAAMLLAHSTRRSNRGSVLRLGVGLTALCSGRQMPDAWRWLSGSALPAISARPAIEKLLVANRGEIACRVLTTGELAAAHICFVCRMAFRAWADRPCRLGPLVPLAILCSQAPGHPYNRHLQRGRSPLQGRALAGSVCRQADCAGTMPFLPLLCSAASSVLCSPVLQHVAMADEAYCIGPAAARESYLRSDRILEVGGCLQQQHLAKINSPNRSGGC